MPINAIAGILGRAATQPDCLCIRQMTGSMCHRPDEMATHALYTELGAALGWVHSHVAPPSNGMVWSRRRQVGVIFTGEEFSDLEGGNTAARTAAFAEAFEVTGIAALAALNGWFSGVIIDLRTATVTLFNDRFGRGRIYYCETSRNVFFASEAKSLLAVRPELRSFDQRGLAEMFAVGCVMQNRSLFTGVSLLPPGSAWTFYPNGRVTKETYFHVRSWEQQPPLTTPEYVARLKDAFARVGRKYLMGDHRVGMSLTGGLDSRAVMAWVSSHSDALPCYTFAGPYRDCADVFIARRVAALCQCPHTTIRVLNGFYSEFGRLAEKAVYLSDGTMDVSGAVELHVNQQAREHAPVRLTGNYGSEVLRSHIAFRPQPVDASLLEPEFAELVKQANRTYAQEAAGNPLSFILSKQVPWHHHARFSVEKSQLLPRSPFLDNEIAALAFQAPPELRGSTWPLLQLIAGGKSALALISTDRGYRLNAIRPLQAAVSAWHEFTAKAEYAFDYGMPDWLARADRKLESLHLERLFLGRHKFYHFRIWYRDQLHTYVRAYTGANSVRDSIYRRGAVARIGDEHLSGRCNRTLDLHRLLTVQLTDRLFLRTA